MKINFSDYDLDGFIKREVNFCGEEAFLIFPESIKTRFTKRTAIFRSSIWSKKGELLSAGAKKFTNWSENTDHFPDPTTIKGADIRLKLDGSLLICTYYNGQLNIRSRGTVNAASLDNGSDWMLLPEKYPKVKEFALTNPDLSLLFEITTPNNKIVINYGDDVEFTLIGIINKKDYSLWTQRELDVYAKQLGVPRPKQYSFSNFEEMFRFCEDNKEVEGFCVYWNKCQSIKKIKTDWYRRLHSLKSELGSYEKVVDFYFSNGMLGYNETLKVIENTLDFEVAQEVAPQISKIVGGMYEVNQIVDFMKNWVEQNKDRERKTNALEIQQKWGHKTNRAGMVFCLLDGKELDRDQYKKLFYQVSKK